MFPQSFSRRDLLKLTAAAASVGAVSSQFPRSAFAQGSVTLNGAGASFPAPLYQRWFEEYGKKNSSIKVNYQSVGSGAGRNQLISGTVDFGASDSAMSDAEIERVSKGVVMVPMTAGSVVVAFNLPGNVALRLSRLALAEIFLGKITKWNDPKLAGINPTIKLPDLPISVVYRSDSSGTTDLFTSHLNAAIDIWATAGGGPGRGSSINWPVGVGARGNEGVSAALTQTPGTISYTEFGYAKSNKLDMARLENKAGKFVAADAKSGVSALDKIELAANLRGFNPDPAGDTSYPIVSYTWILALKKYDDANKAKAMKDVLKWALADGQKFSEDLGYLPLPKETIDKAVAAVNSIA